MPNGIIIDHDEKGLFPLENRKKNRATNRKISWAFKTLKILSKHRQ